MAESRAAAMAGTKPPRVLVIRGGAIGDFILTLPAIRLLREELPARPHLEILGYNGITSLATMAGLADDVRSIEHGSLAPFFAPGAKLDPDLSSYISSFQLVVSYLFDPDEFLAGNLRRCGVKHLLQCSHRVDDEAAVPAASQLARPLEQIALYLEQPWVSIGLEHLASTADSPVIALHPGSGSPRKNWGYERWARLAADLSQPADAGRSFLVVSGEAESSTISDFLNLLTSNGVRFTHLHAAELPNVARALAGCRLFLGHDSGISHLAAAAGVPCLLLFGPTNPVVWAPRNPLVEVLRAPSGQLVDLDPKDVAAKARARLCSRWNS